MRTRSAAWIRCAGRPRRFPLRPGALQARLDPLCDAGAPELRDRAEANGVADGVLVSPGSSSHELLRRAAIEQPRKCDSEWRRSKFGQRLRLEAENDLAERPDVGENELRENVTAN